jgi:hypothetical protein
MLALERARRVRGAAVAVSGVVASLSLAVALTVMVASFRELGHAAGSTRCCPPICTCARPPRPGTGDAAYFCRPSSCWRWRRCPAWTASRCAPHAAAAGPGTGSVTLMSRPLGSTTRCAALPLVGEPLPVPEGACGRFMSARRWWTCMALRPGRSGRWLSRLFGRLPADDGQRTLFFRGRRLARLCAPVRRHGDGQRRLRAPDGRHGAPTTWRCGWHRADPAVVQQAIRALARATGPGSRCWNLLSRRDPRPRCASSTAALPSPTGCRRWPLASACLAWRPASARRCWRGARSSACWRTWASRAARSWPWWPAKALAWTAWARRRAAAGPGRERGAGACGQPAELSLDHGPAACPGCGCWRCAPPWWLAGTVTAWLAGRAAAGRMRCWRSRKTGSRTGTRQ